MPPLSKLGRRVLAHLPAWAEDEAAHVEAEGGPEVSVRSYTRAEFTIRLAEDECIQPKLTSADVDVALAALAEQGLAEERDGWRMTQAGFDALHAPADEGEPGAVFLDLKPAKISTAAAAEGGVA
jgi:hypothetical protein